MEDANRLIEYGNYPEIVAHGIGDVLDIPPNVHIMFFRWRKIDGIFRRCISGEAIRPMISVPRALLLDDWHRTSLVVEPEIGLVLH